MRDREKIRRGIFVNIARNTILVWTKLNRKDATELAEAIYDDCRSDPEFEFSFSYIEHRTFENIQYLD